MKQAIFYYANNPTAFVKDIIKATPDKEQTKILESVAKNQLTTVRSGHGVGKSTVEAWVVIWFLLTRPFPKIPCTAPTQHQLFDILWAEISKWIRNNPILQKDLIWTKEKVYIKGYPEEWFAVARTASKPDALQGFHAEEVLYIIDEASGVDDKIFEPVLGALSTSGARLLMCGNPTQLSGFFYDSHHKNRASYTTFHIDGRNSSRVSQDFVQTIIRMYGEDSDVFRVRVAGEFPLQEEDIFIPLSLVEHSIMTEYSIPQKPTLLHIGADIARFGDDKTVIGYKANEKVTFYKKRRGQDTMKTADDIVLLGEQLVQKYQPTEPIPIKIDDGGVGGGVVDRLRQIKRNQPERFWWMEIYPVKFGQRIQHKHYYDSTTYMMAVVKKLLQPYDEQGNPKPIELILPNDDDMAAQLSGRKYFLTENSKIKIESKKEMKKRGRPSPDEADCILLLCLPIKPPKKRRP
ncbi:MAG: terminase B [Candidatus Gastranaerophilales bacterium]|nr:terminase B [Candidatus Gastranaerophilales bacterium]